MEGRKREEKKGEEQGREGREGKKKRKEEEESKRRGEATDNRSREAGEIKIIIRPAKNLMRRPPFPDETNAVVSFLYRTAKLSSEKSR